MTAQFSVSNTAPRCLSADSSSARISLVLDTAILLVVSVCVVILDVLMRTA